MTESNEELLRAADAVRDICDVCILSSPEDVTYVSGFPVPAALGAHTTMTFATPFVVMTPADASASLAASQVHAEDARKESRLRTMHEFAGFDSFEDRHWRASYLEALQLCLAEAGVTGNTRLGVEGRTLSAVAIDHVRALYPAIKVVEVGGRLQMARAVKTDREIRLIRNAVRVTDSGQRAFMLLTASESMNECAIWSGVVEKMYEAAGRDVPIAGELVSGARVASGRPGHPQNRVTQRGELALLDISCRLDGYWSDTTNTQVMGHIAPTSDQRRVVEATHAAFVAAVEALRPGSKASEVFEAANRMNRRYGLSTPHYLGHQLGTTVNELPRLVPYDHTTIEVNMVFAVEAGAYEGAAGAVGARAEKNVLVTSSGPEVLSQFEWSADS